MNAALFKSICLACLLGLILFVPTTAFSQKSPDLFDFEHGLSFARFLEQKQRFDLAIDEYRRLDQLSLGKLEVRIALLQLYSRLDRPVEGIVAFERWDYPPFQVPGELRRKYMGLHFQSRDFGRLANRVDAGLGLKEPEKTRVQLHLALYELDWPKAEKLFETFEIQHVSRHRLTYEPIMYVVDHMQYRKPLLGALFSIVPGGGQIYAGQWVDGLSTLFLVGVTAYESYRLFHKRGPKNLLAWGLAGLSMSFYIANVYGGQRSVKRYNEKQDARIWKELDGVTVRDF